MKGKYKPTLKTFVASLSQSAWTKPKLCACLWMYVWMYIANVFLNSNQSELSSQHFGPVRATCLAWSEPLLRWWFSRTHFRVSRTRRSTAGAAIVVHCRTLSPSASTSVSLLISSLNLSYRHISEKYQILFSIDNFLLFSSCFMC